VRRDLHTWPRAILAPPAHPPREGFPRIEDELDAGYDQQDQSDELNANDLDFGYRR
jgi:hypothetical protein